jgi:predicted nuclease with RNAse H fold
VLALGIDVGVGKGLDLVALDEQRLPVHDVLPKIGLEQVGDSIRELDPDVIAIDAPPAWAREGRSRLTERILVERNIRTFATPTRARGKGNPFYDWMEIGFRAFRTAARRLLSLCGGRSTRDGDGGLPHASATVLRGCLRPEGIGKKAWREGTLIAQGVRTDRLTSMDLVDAGLCALSGLLALQGTRFAPGDPKEGVIVLPSLHCLPGRSPSSARTRRWFRCPSPRCSATAAAAHRPARRSRGASSLPGHDAKRKSMLWRLARDGRDATDELRRRGWKVPPEIG